MAVSAGFRAPALTSSYHDWDRLRQAHEHMRRAEVTAGMALYRALVQDGFDRYFTEGLWPLHDTPDRPSLVWACIYLAEYCIKMRTWAGWSYLSQRYVFSNPALRLTDGERSRLIGIRGQAQLYARGGNLQKIAAEQRAALGTLQLTDFERGLHHLVLGEIERQFRHAGPSFAEFERALALLSLETGPFYYIRVRENTAVVYDYLKDTNPDYAERAEAVYHEIDRIVDTLGAGAAAERQSYNLGWVYAETQQFDRAMAAFERGYANAARQELSYDQSLNEYGQAFVYLCRDQPDVAVTLLQRARRTFWASASELTTATGEPVSPMMTAVCSNLLALAYDALGQPDDALREAEKALAFQRQIDSPVQLHNALTSLATLYRKQRRWLPAARYGLEERLLRRRLRK